jgi:hypothetical protein
VRWRATARATTSVGDSIWGRGKERDSLLVGVLEWLVTGSASVQSSWRPEAACDGRAHAVTDEEGGELSASLISSG